ncbi:tail fiber assembly protein [Burkholderia ubonensis]|uniref:tail fiber assembly protein n=1 Tax=Burkholderia ubonensis TaxID=101571 RepID=UPI002AB1C4FB|nr:tail fiber assembly protein [Burkholderia ubonensis]
MTDFLTMDELWFVLRQEFPHLIGGQDYLLARKLDPVTEGAIEHARIDVWPDGIERPASEWIHERVAFHKQGYVEYPVREKRDALLAATDWTQAPDVPEATASKYADYREALRDLPEQAGWPNDIQWPALPT